MDITNITDKDKLLYEQVKDFILLKIDEGDYEVGQVIPPERQLCELLDVSRYTVRKAIKELVGDGYLYRVQGNGTFVFERKRNKPQKSKFFGVVLPSGTAELEMKILSGIQQGLKGSEYKMTFRESQGSYQEEAKHIQELVQEGVAGLIILPEEDQTESTAIADLKEGEIPFVLVDRSIMDCETNCVHSDNISAGFMATQHLIKLGHRRICFIKHGITITSSVYERITGYKKAIEDYNLDFSRIYNIEDEDFPDFLQKNNITAAVIVNSVVALDIVKYCREKEIKIPHDLSVVSFDNLNIIKHLETPLTTVAQYSKEIGERAANLLIEKIAQQQTGQLMVYTQLAFPTRLIKRESCLDIN